MKNLIAWAILALAIFEYLFLKTEESQRKATAVEVILSPFILALAAYITHKY